jgi:hypothetical protein
MILNRFDIFESSLALASTLSNTYALSVHAALYMLMVIELVAIYLRFCIV